MFSDGASNMVLDVDRAFAFIFIVAAIFIVGITGFMIWVAIRYNQKRVKKAQQFRGSVSLEIIWTVIPLILVMFMFYYGWVGFSKMRAVPDDAMEITAIGRMWEWEFDYGEGKLSKQLVIPVNTPVKINLLSEDVNHSLFIPAFRVKEDVVPGYDNYLWFTPYVVGEFDLLCTEYCGLMHSSMTSKTIVKSETDFATWLDNLEATGDIPDPEGLVLLKNTACLSCHSQDGSKIVGPTFKGLYGSEQIVVEGNSTITVVADDDYIKRSIIDPDAQINEGYGKGLMKSYRDELTDEEIAKIIEYLKTLSN
jgi:cytochrome c oxidase subunit 2